MTSLTDQLRRAMAFDEAARVAHLESIGVSRSDAEWAAILIATEYAQLHPLLEKLFAVCEAAESVVDTHHSASGPFPEDDHSALCEARQKCSAALADLRELVGVGE